MSNLRQQREALENEHRYYQKRLDSIEQEYHYMKRDMMNHTDRLCNWTSHFIVIFQTIWELPRANCGNYEMSLICG
ncbi:hypothetical protein [Streptococcus intermedius]|uniref:hypothetical protein n=1 Tax=Streptococcus intermedius TaxID=1338 RepID=UPI0020006213|nr:hypothetical protein [Streptococcus intermedius]